MDRLSVKILYLFQSLSDRLRMRPGRFEALDRTQLGLLTPGCYRGQLLQGSVLDLILQAVVALGLSPTSGFCDLNKVMFHAISWGQFDYLRSGCYF